MCRTDCMMGRFVCAFVVCNQVKVSLEEAKIIHAIRKAYLSYEVGSRSDIKPCNKIDKPLVVYRFSGNIMTSITTLHTHCNDKIIMFLRQK